MTKSMMLSLMERLKCLSKRHNNSKFKSINQMYLFPFNNLHKFLSNNKSRHQYNNQSNHPLK